MHPHNLPFVDIKLITDLQKAAFVRGKTILEIFSEAQGALHGRVSRSVFKNTIQDCSIWWSMADQDDLFNKLCEMEARGRNNEVDAQTIDELVFFACKQKLRDMHKAMLV